MPPPQNQQASVPQGGNQQIQNQPPRQYNAVAPPQMYHPDPSNSQNRAPRPQKKGPRRDNDYPLPGSFVTAITILMGNGQVQLPPERKTAPYPGLDFTKYCPFHRSPGHTLETCWDARDLIYDLHETGRIDWDALQACQNNRRNMGIVENPLPNHQQAVQQPVQQNPNQNQNQAQVNTLFSSEELSPQDRGIGGTHQSLNWELQDTGVEWQGPVQSTIEEPTQCTTDDVEAPDSTSVSANTQERPLATRLRPPHMVYRPPPFAILRPPCGLPSTKTQAYPCPHHLHPSTTNPINSGAIHPINHPHLPHQPSYTIHPATNLSTATRLSRYAPQPVTPPQPTPSQPIQPISTQASQAFPDQTNSPTVSLVLPPTTPSPTQTTTPSTDTPLGQNPPSSSEPAGSPEEGHTPVISVEDTPVMAPTTRSGAVSNRIVPRVSSNKM